MRVGTTARAQLAVLRQQRDVPMAVITAIERHLDAVDHIAAQRYRSDAETERVATVTAQTIAAINQVLANIPTEAEAWRSREAAKVDTPTPYAVTALDEMTLRDGAPAELEELVARSGGHPTVTQVAVRRLEQLYRQQQHPVSHAAFEALCRLRTPQARPVDRGARLRDLDMAARRRLTLQRGQILAAAAIVGITEADLRRARARAALSATT